MKKIICGVLFFTSYFCMAHPHLFIENSYTFKNSGSRLEGVHVKWVFDPYFTKQILFDFDRDEDNFLNEDEIQLIHDYAFINLANYNYFQIIRQNNVLYELAEVEDFHASLEEVGLTYTFFYPLDIPSGQLQLATYDPTFYCSIEFPEKEKYLFTDTSYHFQLSITTDYDSPVYYDPLAPANVNELFTEWKPGLKEFYPEVVSFAHE